MKKKHLIIIAILMGLLFLFSMDKCGNSEKLRRLRRENRGLEAAWRVEQKLSRDAIEEKEREISAANEKISLLETTVEEKNDEIDTLTSEIGDLENAYDEEAPPEEQIVNLKKQVALWKAKFILAETIIATKDKIIFSLTAAYDAQVLISNEYKGMYEKSLEINDGLKREIKLMRRQAGKIKTVSKIKNLALTILGGIMVYDLVKN